MASNDNRFIDEMLRKAAANFRGGNMNLVQEEARLEAARRRPNLSFLSFSIEDMLARVRHQHFNAVQKEVRLCFVNEGSLACVLIEDRQATICVHQVLNHPDTPTEVMSLICKHELLHLQFPGTVTDGKRVKHSPAFRAAERMICPERLAAWRWLRTNLTDCLKARPVLERIDVRRSWRKTWGKARIRIEECEGL